MTRPTVRNGWRAVTNTSDAGDTDSPTGRSGTDHQSAAGSGPPGERLDESGREPSAAGPLPRDVVFDLLSNERRRFTLRYLRENGSTPRGELAEELAAYENGKPRDEITSQERKRVDVSLFQSHLPRMEEHGVVESERNLQVELGANADQLFAVLDPEPGCDSGPPPVYPAAAIVGLVGLGVWSAAGAVAATAGAVVAGLSLLAVLATACVEWLEETGTDSGSRPDSTTGI